MKSNRVHFANKILTKIDNSANKIEKLAADGKLDPKLAARLVSELDRFSDRFQVASFGPESLRLHQAKVLECGPQDSVMKSLGNPNGVLERDADEDYMKEFDTDMTSQIQELLSKTWPNTGK